MKNLFSKKASVFTLIILIASSLAFADLKLEFPTGLDFMEAVTDTSHNINRMEPKAFLWPIYGPVRSQWIIPAPDGWSFGAGLHVGFSQGYSVGPSLSADKILHKFRNGPDLVLDNTLDFGYLNYVTHYVDANTGDKSKKYRNGFIITYMLRGDFVWKYFYAGLGPVATCWFGEGKVNLEVGAALSLGFRINTDFIFE